MGGTSSTITAVVAFNTLGFTVPEVPTLSIDGDIGAGYGALPRNELCTEPCACVHRALTHLTRWRHSRMTSWQ